MFEFKDPGRLIDGDLELVLVEEYAGDPDIGFIPAYRFEMRLTAADTKVGNTHHIVMYGCHIPQKMERNKLWCNLLRYLLRSAYLRGILCTEANREIVKDFSL